MYSMALGSGENVQVTHKFLELASGDEMKQLMRDGAVSNGSPQSLELTSSVADYQVTTGKTAKVVIILESGSLETQFKIWESNSANSATGTTKFTYAGTQFSSSTIFTVPELSFAASKYITIEVTSSSDSLSVLSAFAIES